MNLTTGGCPRRTSGVLTVNHQASQVIMVWSCLSTRYAAENHTTMNSWGWSSQRKTAEIMEDTRTISRNAQASQCHNCCALRTTDVHGEPSQSVSGVTRRLLIGSLQFWHYFLPQRCWFSICNRPKIYFISHRIVWQSGRPCWYLVVHICQQFECKKYVNAVCRSCLENILISQIRVKSIVLQKVSIPKWSIASWWPRQLR